MINEWKTGKHVERSGHSPFQRTILVSAWREGGKTCKSSLQSDGVHVKIRTSSLPLLVEAVCPVQEHMSNAFQL
jgi:hypothetical protein